MSKITNDGLTRSGWHSMLYSCTNMATAGIEGLIEQMSDRKSILIQSKMQDNVL